MTAEVLRSNNFTLVISATEWIKILTILNQVSTEELLQEKLKVAKVEGQKNATNVILRESVYGYT